jgi:hypothetical protein
LNKNIGKDNIIKIYIDSTLIKKDKMVNMVNSTLFNCIKLLSLEPKELMRLDKATETVKILADV